MIRLLIAKDVNHAKQLSKQYHAGKIRKIYRGIYTDDRQLAIEKIIETHWMQIVAHIVPAGILSFRTAAELKLIPFQKKLIVFMTSSYHKTITLPGLIIKIIKGNSHDYTEQVLPQLARSNCARLLLENLSTIRSADYQQIKTIGTAGVEHYCAKELQLRGEKHLNKIRDQAKEMSTTLHFLREYKKLNQIISALLSTNTDCDALQSPYAMSVAKKEPYDPNRIKLFEDFILYLK